MISRSDFESIPESASSLDYNPRARLQGSIFTGSGDPYLRISKDTESEILRAGEEAEGPDYDLEEKIRSWKKHVKEFATGAGFRKASRGQVDPRRFALHLSRIAFKHAQQYGSRSLLKIAKQLRWAASQSRKAAETALQNISDEDPEDTESVGVPRIEKPGESPIPQPQWGAQRGAPQVDPQVTPVYPGSTREQVPDQYWSSERTGSRRRRANNEPNSDLIQYALDFLEDYRSTNSLADDEELMDKLNESEVYESWLVDLDSKGVLADPEDLDKAWNQALSETTNGSSVSDKKLPSDITMSKRSPTDDPKIQEYMSPGGDWFNSVLDTNTHPGFDRYIKRKMSSYNWANGFLEDDHQSSLDGYLRRADSKSSLEEKILHAVDQCLDHFAGEMVPSEISPDHVRQFIEQDFPGVSWKKVYDAIEEIADPKKRHDKERTNDDYHASRHANSSFDPRKVWEFVNSRPFYNKEFHPKTKSALEIFNENIANNPEMLKRYEAFKGSGRTDEHSDETTNRKRRDFLDRADKRGGSKHSASSTYYHSSFDTIESTPNRKYSHLQGHREICACCTGTGQEGAGACSRCQGSGRHGLDPDDPQVAAKGRVIDRVGSLLLVEVRPDQLTSKGRQALSRVTHTRVASGSLVRYTHSPELMRFLVNYDVPFKVVGYTHPNYKPAKKKFAAAVHTISPDQAMAMLGIKGTGSLQGDKKLLHGLALKYHSDRSHPEESEEKMRAINVLRDLYIRKGEELPAGAAPRQQPSRPSRPSYTPGYAPGVMSERELNSKIYDGFILVDEVGLHCGIWVSHRKNCDAIHADLQEDNTYERAKKVMEAISSLGRGQGYFEHAAFTDLFPHWFAVLEKLYKYCKSPTRGSENYLNIYIEGLQAWGRRINALSDAFNAYYEEFMYGRNNYGR